MEGEVKKQKTHHPSQSYSSRSSSSFFSLLVSTFALYLGIKGATYYGADGISMLGDAFHAMRRVDFLLHP